MTKTPQLMYYRLVDEKKQFYVLGKLIGDELKMKQYLINDKGISYSKAKKTIDKIKLWKEDKHEKTISSAV